MLLFSTAVVFASAVVASPLSDFAKRTSASSSSSGPAISHIKLKAFKEPSKLAETSNVVSLTRKSNTAGSRLMRAAQGGVNATVKGEYGIWNATTASDGQILLTSFQVGDEWFEAVLDTGSSDTWLVQTGFKCEDTLGTIVPEANCKFGATYDTGSTFTPIPDQNFRISYADGETATGILGRDTVTLANITVYNQTIGVVNKAAWRGDSVSSGLIGLAYPALTSAYNGTNVTADSRETQIQYEPVFTNMYSQGGVDPLFTLKLERENGSSTLAIGGLPPLDSGLADDFTSVPIEIMKLNPFQNPKFATQNSYYTITPKGFVYRNATSHGVNNSTLLTGADASIPQETLDTKYPTIVDSGTSMIYLPSAQVVYINAAFDPPTEFDRESGYDVIPCDAKAPEFGVVIGDTPFYINAEDMILDLGLPDGLCASGVQNGGGAVNILGDVFLRNVIAVFDVGQAEMRFAPHVYY